MSTSALADCSRHGGGYWVWAAALMPSGPLLLGAAAEQDRMWDACLTRYGTPSTAIPEACAARYAWLNLFTVGFWGFLVAASLTGIILGLVDGRARRRFAHGRWISAGTVGICAPWALLAYALGHCAGRLRPPRRPSAAQQARLGGWYQAVQLYKALAAGRFPPAVLAPDLPNAGAVYMDVPFRYSRLFGCDVTYQPGGMVAIGSSGFVAGAAVGRLIGTSIGYARAASMSRRRWRGHEPSRVVVTATSTWCQVGGRWLRFDHDAVVGYQVEADQSCVLAFDDVPPLRLYGPSAWCHAVLFAYLRNDDPYWHDAPFLHPLRQAA